MVGNLCAKFKKFRSETKYPLNPSLQQPKPRLLHKICPSFLRYHTHVYKTSVKLFSSAL